MFDKVLVAVDGSEGSLKALEAAVSLNKAFKGDLIILTVYRHHSMMEVSMSMVRPEEPTNLDEVLKNQAMTVAEDFKQKAIDLGAENIRAFVKNGPPARTIVKFSEDKDADLIVLGGRGHGDIEGFLLGSVSHKVTGLANCAVMVT